MIAADRPLPREAYLSWVDVNLAAVRHNAQLIKRLLPPGFPVFGVVKADAYGHGAVPVAKVLVEEGYAMLCVARVEEALELRRSGMGARVLVLAPPFRPQADVALAQDCAMVVCAPEHIDAMAAAANAAGRPGYVHLKLDTGMGRLGARPEDAIALARRIAENDLLKLEGVMAHFPTADEPDATLTNQQIESFAAVQRDFASAGIPVQQWHTANTAGILQHPSARFTAVRSGIALYGQYPGPKVSHTHDLRAAMSLRTRIAFLKYVPEGTGLGYGHTYHTKRASRIATIPLGYADGYPRHASNKTTMLVRGQRVPQVGRVSMDHILLDVTDVSDVSLGDVVTAFGVAESEALTAEEVAYSFDSLGYELTTRVGKRLPRYYSS